jgi:hypothetical protein
MHQCWSARRKATADGSNSSKVHRHEGQFATVPIKPDIFTLPRCTSSESFFSCFGSVAALALANCNKHVAEASILRPHPPTPSVLCKVPKAQEVGLVKPLIFLVRDTRARATCISCFPCKTTTEFLTFLRSFPTFFPACSPPPGCFFAQNCAHAGGPVR